MLKKIILFFLFLLIFGLLPQKSFAAPNSFVSIVNPIRGDDFWEDKTQKPIDGVKGEVELLKQNNLPATFLIRPDALANKEIINLLKSIPRIETGLFLEITPSWTKKAGVQYQKSETWHSAGSIFLTGYSVNDRVKLIDQAFNNYKDIFGFYPKSVGAWFVDSYSLEYMQSKYNVDGSLIVADQYSTDNYQIWGQYWGTPYYPQKRHTLVPAQNKIDKLDVVITQWAARDPVNGYGKAVEESTYSVQANDYIDYHELDINYFSKLVDLYTNQKYNKFNQLVVGLENSYSWDKYKKEYSNQINVLTNKQKLGQFRVVTLGEFSSWYKKNFPDVSPEQIIVSDDPLNTDNKTVWFMNPYYRVGWFYNSEGSVIRDIRQYLESQEQLCYNKPCQKLNFATNSTRVLDDVSFSYKWLLDEGKISKLTFVKSSDKFSINYENEAKKQRTLSLLLRDITFDGKTTSIDATILAATRQSDEDKKNINNSSFNTQLLTSMLFLIGQGFIFILFIVLAFAIPGYVLIKSIFKRESNNISRLFLSISLGIVIFTLSAYIAGFLRLWFFILIPVIFLDFIYFFKKYYQEILNTKITRTYFVYFLILLAGIIFQTLPTFKSGLVFEYGMGFWGPNTHDGVWHISLINQIVKGLPAQNPIYSGELIKNYHYLFDLLIAATAIFTRLSISDLLFRFFPMLFSLLLGFGSITLIQSIYSFGLKQRAIEFSTIFSLLLVYFAGSFGWIVTWLQYRILAGESAFWANQAISFNLNPPFAVSLIVVILGIILLDFCFKEKNYKVLFLTSLVIGSLMGFKAYAAVLTIGSLIICSFIYLIFKRRINLFVVSLGSILVTLGIYLPNFKYSNTFVFSPFWFIHTMIDFKDRVGWVKLSTAREAYFERGDTLKYFLSEILGFILFIAGNLGVRVIGLFSLFNAKLFARSFLLQYILIFNLLALVITLLFIQQGTAWNTIQFFYYLMFFASIAAGFVLAWIYLKLPKILALIIIAILVVLIPINSISTAKGYLYPLPHAFISQRELEALSFLKEQKEAGVILTIPFNKEDRSKTSQPYPLFIYDSTAYVSALSTKQVYLEDEMQNDILELDYKKRRVEAKNFFADKGVNQEEFLKNNQIKYIYVNKYYNQTLEEKNLISRVFENDEVLIYKVN